MATSDSPQTGIYKQQHTGRGTTMVADQDAVLDFTSATVRMPSANRQGLIDLGPHIWSARELSSGENITSGTTAPAYFFGGLLLADTTPALRTNTTDGQAGAVRWESAVVDAIKLAPIAMPADLSTAAGLTVQLMGKSVGSATAADAIAGIQIKAWNGTATADIGSTHPNFTTTPSYQGISITSGNTPTTGGVLNLTLVPQAHAGRAIDLFGGRIIYTKKTS